MSHHCWHGGALATITVVSAIGEAHMGPAAPVAADTWHSTLLDEAQKGMAQAAGKQAFTDIHDWAAPYLSHLWHHAETVFTAVGHWLSQFL